MSAPAVSTALHDMNDGTLVKVLAAAKRIADKPPDQRCRLLFGLRPAR